MQENVSFENSFTIIMSPYCALSQLKVRAEMAEVTDDNQPLKRFVPSQCGKSLQTVSIIDDVSQVVGDDQDHIELPDEIFF